jgi:hypothetical protein
MADRNESLRDNQNSNSSDPGAPGSKSSTNDLTDSRSDRERLKEEVSYTDFPEVKDIPGQERITNIGPLGEMADTTASSDDEEGVMDGKDITGEDNDLDIVMGTDADVTKEDLRLLGDRSEDMDGSADAQTMGGLDDDDMEGDPLNEAAVDLDTPGDDLDLPGNEDIDPDAITNELDDEENDYYSTPDQGDNNEE